jgi:hypothetical protein
MGLHFFHHSLSAISVNLGQIEIYEHNIIKTETIEVLLMMANWVVTLCSLVGGYQRFRGRWRLFVIGIQLGMWVMSQF